MQTANFRYIALSLIFLAAAGLYFAFGESLGAGTPRWPHDDAVYAVNGWSVGPESVERVITADFVTRVYRSPDGVPVTLTIETYQSPKLYAAGPEVPFLGSGFVVTTPSTDLVPASTGNIGSLLAQRGTDSWLVMYAYGERRGLLGNGAVGWTFALADSLLGRQNDYYKLYLSARTDGLNPGLNRDLSGLAHIVFPRVQAWYGA